MSILKKDSKEKSEDSSFDINDFINSISIKKSQPVLEKKASSTSDSHGDNKPQLSSRAKRFLEKIEDSGPKPSKDVLKARKEIEKSAQDLQMRRQLPKSTQKKEEKSFQVTSQNNPSRDTSASNNGTKLNVKKKPPSQEFLRVTKELQEMNRNYEKVKKDPNQLKRFKDLLARKAQLLKKESQKPLHKSNEKNNQSRSSEDSDSSSSSGDSESPSPKKNSSVKKIKSIKNDKIVDPKPSKKPVEYSPLDTFPKKKSSTSEAAKPKTQTKVEYDPLNPNPSKNEKKLPKANPEKVKIEKFERPPEKKVQKEKSAPKEDYKPKPKPEKSRSSHPRYYDFDDEGDDYQAELNKLLGGYRNRRFDDGDVEEARFDDIDAEEKYSRKIGEIEDRIEYEKIKKENKKHKKKH